MNAGVVEEVERVRLNCLGSGVSTNKRNNVLRVSKYRRRSYFAIQTRRKPDNRPLFTAGAGTTPKPFFGKRNVQMVSWSAL